MLGRYQRGNSGPIQFVEVRDRLKQLLLDFGPSSSGSPNVLDPFWRLQNDVGNVWTVEDGSGARIAKTTGPPSITELVDRNATGNFTRDIRSALVGYPSYTTRLAAEILAAHFPRSLHEDIGAATGLELTEDMPDAPKQGRQTRDGAFRSRIILAYEHRCAVTGWDLRIGHTDAGLEAAHIKWHIAGGPCVEQNGIALNALHHKLFDLGAFTLSLDDKIPRILVSREVHGGNTATEMLISLHGSPIRPPQDAVWMPDRDFIGWHRAQVFKGEPRA